jgi:NMD protein affecting ribosome stability and mRNA decay
MPLSACPRCKKIFDKTRSAVCTRCQDAEDNDFDKIRAVLDRSPNLNAEQVAEEAEVTVDCVMRMIAEGLIASVSLTEQIKCGRCGAPAISLSKRLCQACLEKLNSEMAQAQSKIKIGQKKPVQVDEHLHARRALDEKRRS